MLRVFVPAPPAPGPLELRGGEAHHLLRVRRAGPGDAVVVFCGDGREYPARVGRATRRGVVLEIGPGVPVDREPRTRIVVGAALLPARAFDLLVLQAAELGAAAVVPVLAERCVARAGGASQAARWRRIVIEAAKQCGRNRLAEVPGPRPLDRFLAEAAGPRWIASPGAPPLLSRLPAEPPAGVTLLVGPEGGFTREEEAAALAAGFAPAGLAPALLRSETAVLAAVAAVGMRYAG